MRTKTLLLTAALAAAGAASAMAQNVYSVNAVGYANVALKAGFNMVGNPFVTASSTLESLIPSPPDQTVVYPYDNGGYSGPFTYFGAPDNIWDPAGGVITFGHGAFIFAPSAFTITFVGEVQQGAPIHNAFIPGFNMLSSKVPQQADIASLGLSSPPDQTAVYTYDADTGYHGPWTYFGAPDNIWDPADIPVLKIGEAMWLNSPTAGDWTRTFSVN
jgi:hypothetical protein